MQKYKNVLAVITVLAQIFFISTFAVATSYADDTTGAAVVLSDTPTTTAIPADAGTVVAPSDTPSVDTTTVADEVTTTSGSAIVSTDTTESALTTDAANVDTTTTSSPTDSTTNAPLQAAVLASDKADYNPGQTASIFGTFFGSLQNIVLRIFGGLSDNGTYTESTQNITTDEQGSFATTYTLDNVFRPLYTVVAQSTADGVELARMTFTDAGVDVYTQCANGTGGGPTCNWTSGDLNQNNSAYYEGDATVQRLAIDGLATGDHTVTVQYDTTKGGKHAYDFLTDDRFSENWVTNADLCSSPISNFASCASATPVLSSVIPSDANANGHDTAASPRHFTIRNGSWVSGGIVSGPTLVSGTYGGDSSTNIQLKFHVDATTCANVHSNTCEVLITWGAHVSTQADWGAGTSAVNINGSPYHVRVVEFEGGSVGKRDNQMAASAVITPSTITVHKVTSNGDSATAFSYTTTGTGYSNFNLVGGAQNAQSVAPGSYSVTEGALSGWSNTALTCTASGQGSSANANLSTHSVAITVGSGGGATIDCTYTNTLQQGHLTLVKTVTNDNGGTAANTAWTLSASGPTSISGTTGAASVTNAAVNAGTYTLGETGPSGYTAGAWSCTAGTLSGNSLVLVAGQSATCTINNNDQPGTLIVKKVLVNDNGGTAGVTNFSYKVNGAADVTFEADGQNDATVNAGTYSVVENAAAGYAATYNNCTNVVIPNGGTATCTITNNDIAPTLTLLKTVINDNGGNKDVSDFVLKIDATGVVSGTATVVNAGTHTASEINLAGYTASVWGGDCAADGSITLALGDNKICTITNNDQPGTLHVIKHVVNDNGGTLGADNFTITVGNSANPASFAGSEAGADVTVNAGTYSATEDAVTGYTQTGNDCSGTIANGETKTCTITNDDNAPKLTLVKDVVNDNGGEAVAGDWTLTATGYNAQNPQIGTYDLAESGGPDGYTQTSLTCSNATGQVAAVTLGLGDDVTCTFVNDDNAPSLTLVKNVVIDNGGTAVATDWNLSASGPTSIAGAGGVTSDATFKAGTYVLSESVGPAGYSASTWTCVGGTQDGSSVTLGLGESATCTITNDDIAPQLTVIKHVVNDNGGTAGANDFTMNVAATNPSDASFAGDELGTTITLHAGSYAVTESGLSGYTESDSADCSGTIGIGETKTCTITNDDQPGTLVVNKVLPNDNGGTATADQFSFSVNGGGAIAFEADGSNQMTVNAGTYNVVETNPMVGYTLSYNNCANVLVPNGGTATCTITNDDEQAYITVTKVVNNNHGGTADPDDFNLSLNGNGVTSGVVVPVNPGTYTAGETNLFGYTFEGFSGECDANGDVTVALGESKTCTLTNNDQPGTLIVRKVVDNGNTGATTGADAFSFSVNGGDTSSFESDGQNDLTVNAGTYSVAEPAVAGYTTTYDNCTDVVVPNGGTATCTVTNTAIAPTLKIMKTVINNNGGTLGTSDFQGTIDSNNVAWGVAVPTVIGAHNASEVTVAGYTASAWGGDCAADGSVSLALGETKTCTITNDDQPAHLIVIKHVINDDNNDAVAADFTMNVTGTNVSNTSFAGSEAPGVTVTLNAGAYGVTEGAHAGYIETYSADCSGSIGVGETKTCTITNNDKPFATRTLGYWQTHTNFSTATLGTGWVLGAKNVDTAAKLFAGFYAPMSKTTTGNKRTALDQARIAMLQQWQAAKLNCIAFGCNTGTLTLLANAATAWTSGTAGAINSYASQLDTYNNSNDSMVIASQGKATPAVSQTLAAPQLSFWNVLP